jgi:hypothetical protein
MFYILRQSLLCLKAARCVPPTLWQDNGEGVDACDGLLDVLRPSILKIAGGSAHPGVGLWAIAKVHQESIISTWRN